MEKVKYRNYSEQVSKNVSELELFDGELPDGFWEDLFDLCYDNLDEDYIKKEYEEQEGINTIKYDNDEFLDFKYEYIYSSFEGIYQVFKVKLKGSYNSEHERLEIVWNDELNCYLMPVYHFGTAWSYIGEMN